MLMRHAQVARSGEYTRPPHPKLGYGTMIAIRAEIVKMASVALATALTISVRYSAVRRQGDMVNETNRESKVLDYPFQQQRLLTGVGLAYGLFFTGKYMSDLYQRTQTGNQLNASQLAHLHALSSGLKALCSELVLNALEDSRRACGGHGYSTLSGFPHMIGSYAQNVTVEGDNVILHLQTGRFLINLLRSVRSESSDKVVVKQGLLAYLHDNSTELRTKSRATSIQAVLDPAFQLDVLQHRDKRQLVELEKALELEKEKANGDEAAARQVLMVDIIHVSKSFCETVLLHNFQEGIKTIEVETNGSASFLGVLRKLCSLYGLHTIDTHRGDFLEDGYLNVEELSVVKAAIRRLLSEIRRDAVPLVDAFEIGDNQLASSLGRYDGRVYEDLYAWACQDPNNVAERQNGVILGYNEVLKDLFTVYAKL
eukprot:TRINITY_DN306_c0_g1_i1.p1 TRINITY_DN306_c0_g1~~TRINITY_DN306_c0_g1_i1.p1  ORF type:complete len:426 (+),score=88.70 TRINITY_DN306_c0_g1_i1:872-2149(+)